jgi:hypothetical protein
MRAIFLALLVSSLLAFLLAIFLTLASPTLAILALALSAFDWVQLVVAYELGPSSRKSIAPGGGRALLVVVACELSPSSGGRALLLPVENQNVLGSVENRIIGCSLVRWSMIIGCS